MANQARRFMSASLSMRDRLTQQCLGFAPQGQTHAQYPCEVLQQRVTGLRHLGGLDTRQPDAIGLGLFRA